MADLQTTNSENLNSERGNLEFHKTLTVEQFKAEKDTEKIEVKKNPITGRLFFSYGPLREDIGAVSSKGIPTHPMLSFVTGDKGDFWLMHEEGQGAPTIATF